MQSPLVFGGLAIALAGAFWMLMYAVVYFTSQTRSRLSPLGLLLRADYMSERERGAAAKALWSLVGLSFIIPAAVGLIEKWRPGDKPPTQLSPATPFPSQVFDYLSATLIAGAALVCLIFLVLAIIRHLAVISTPATVTRDLRWSTIASLVAAGQIALLLVLHK